MATDDCKRFLSQSTGVPEKAWKRRSKSLENGLPVRVFENSLTGEAVSVSELPDGSFAMGSMAAAPSAPAIPDYSAWRSSSGRSVHDLVEAIVSFEDANDPSFAEAIAAGMGPAIASHFLFGVFEDPDFGLNVAICLADYWVETGYMYDNEINIYPVIPHLSSLSESIFEFEAGHVPPSIRKAEDYLLGFGLKQHKPFSDFIATAFGEEE